MQKQIINSTEIIQKQKQNSKIKDKSIYTQLNLNLIILKLY